MILNVGFKAHYFQELAEVEAGNFWFRARNLLILWSINKYYPKMRSFLEIGCGTGFVLSGISKGYPKAELLGSEYFEEGLAFARIRVPTAMFMQMDARYIPFQEEFDAIGAFDVLEHIDEDHVVLQQMFKSLKPGGIAFITVPQHRWLWSVIDEYACHVRRYSADELHSKVSQAGFDVLRSTSFVSVLLPAMCFSRLMQGSKKNITATDSKAELRVNSVLNRLFEFVLFVERLLIRTGISFPVGGSRLLVAQKPLNNNQG